MRTRHFLPLGVGLLLLTGSAPRVLAQCPNGSPPPCGSAVLPAPDPDRIAIFPFHVGGAGSDLRYLGEGMPILLAVEFAGDGRANAVDPHEALRAWQRAGGNRRILTPREQLRLAHELGAGQLLIGSVVGVPQQFTFTASILNVPSGAVRVRTITVATRSDSLPIAIATVAARLQSRAVGAWRLSANHPGTTSTEALKAYLAGHAAWRGARNPDQATALFSDALQADSTFVLAAYWTTILRRMQNVFPQDARAFELAWRYRDRLNHVERELLEAALGPEAPGPVTSRAAVTMGVERAMAHDHASAEGWFLLGDRYLHDGAQMGVEDWAARSRRAFERSLAIDTLGGALSHYADVLAAQGDWRAHARVVPLMAGERLYPLHRYLAAVATGRPAAIAAARANFVEGFDVWLFNVEARPSIAEADSVWSALRRLGRRQWLGQEGHHALNAGQLERGMANYREAGLDSARTLIPLLLFAAADSAAASQALALADREGRDSLRFILRCEGTLGRLRIGDTTGAMEAARRLQDGLAEIPLCSTLIAAIVSSFRGELSGLNGMDSVLKTIPRTFGFGHHLAGRPGWNHDLGIAYARLGRYASAAAAARRRLFSRTHRYAVTRRDEGLWALAAGDTASARPALEEYVHLRSNPDPALRADVEAVRTRLAALGVKQP